MVRLEAWLLIPPLVVTELSRRGAGLARQRRPLGVRMRKTPTRAESSPRLNKRTSTRRAATALMGHVWTAPGWQ